MRPAQARRGKGFAKRQQAKHGLSVSVQAVDYHQARRTEAGMLEVIVDPIAWKTGPSYIYDEESAIYSSLILVAEELGLTVKSAQ
jgi:hypothetical protein